MRAEPSPAEAKLWEALKAGQAGALFRRQVRIGRFVADFSAPGLHLIVEVDGAYHRARRAADARRDAKLSKLGYRVVRLSAQLVLEEFSSALELVRVAVESAVSGLNRCPGC